MEDQSEPKPNKAVNDEPCLVFNKDEQLQLAKFIDALLEADMNNKSNERKLNNESVLSHISSSNI